MEFFIKQTLKDANKLLKEKEHVNSIAYKEKKGSTDYSQILTENDLMIQDFIINRIHSNYPNVNIISEEKENSLSLNRCWILDPIDGTMNYVRGLGEYSISMSYWENEEPVCSGVIIPTNDNLYHAIINEGAYLNNKRIKVTKCTNPNKSILLLSNPFSFEDVLDNNLFNRITSKYKNIRIYSSSVLDMCKVAEGACEARIYTGCKIWDLAAAYLILKEAGGIITDWNGEQDVFSKFIVAANSAIHGDIIQVLNYQ